MRKLDFIIFEILGAERTMLEEFKRRSCSIEQLESDSVAKPNPGAWTAARSLSLPSQPGGWLRRV